MATDPKAQGWISEAPEPEDLPSHIQTKLEPETRAPAPSRQSSVDRSAETVRPRTSSPEVAPDSKPSSTDGSDVPSVPGAPRVPVI